MEQPLLSRRRKHGRTPLKLACEDPLEQHHHSRQGDDRTTYDHHDPEEGSVPEAPGYPKGCKRPRGQEGGSNMHSQRYQDGT